MPLRYVTLKIRFARLAAFFLSRHDAFRAECYEAFARCFAAAFAVMMLMPSDCVVASQPTFHDAIGEYAISAPLFTIPIFPITLSLLLFHY